jgi:DNA-binding YbaB/EbfC family protein
MNLGKMMKDLQKMQAKLQAEIETLEVEASSGGGMVTARMNGKKELLSLKLTPEAVTPDDLELLEDLKIPGLG